MAESASARRGLSWGEIVLGTAGQALLRLHAANGDAMTAAACVDEIRQILADLNAPPYSDEVRGPLLDVASGYARWAGVYDEPGNPLVAVDDVAVRPLLDRLPAGPICDAACGTGRHLAYLADAGREVIGVDLSLHMLEKARGKVPSADLRLGDLRDLPLEDSEVNSLVCSLALEHVDRLDLVYQEFARVVRPGGLILVSTIHPVMRSGFGWWAWFRDDQGRGDIATHSHQVSDYLNAALRAGLTPGECLEPLVSRELAAKLAPAEAPMAGLIALSGVPILLVMVFVRP